MCVHVCVGGVRLYPGCARTLTHLLIFPGLCHHGKRFCTSKVMQSLSCIYILWHSLSDLYEDAASLEEHRCGRTILFKISIQGYCI